MTLDRRAVAGLVLPALAVLGGCASLGGGPAAAERDTIAARSEPAGIAPELVLITQADGFALATQSVGVVGDDGLSAVYVRSDRASGGTLTLTTSHDAPPGAVPCGDLPDSGDPARCWVERAGVHALLEGEGVDPATVRSAADAVRVPAESELDLLFAGLALPGPPVERGDLPPDGDGAPLDPPGAGG